MPKFERDGATLHYELDGTGPPAVYIGGFSSHSNDVLGTPLRYALSTQYTVLAVDNRGSGQSLAEDSGDVTLATMADDIAALMDHHGMGAAHTLGISMGGAIGLTLALRHPEKVRSQVIAVSLAQTNMGSRAEFLLRTNREMRDRGVPQDLISRYNAVYLISEDMFLDEGLMTVWVNSLPDAHQQTRAGFDLQIEALRDFNIVDQLPTITAPTLVISSPDDLLVPPRFQEEIAANIPNAEMKHYPGGHVFMALPMYSAQFVADVLAFWSKNSTDAEA